MTGLFRTKTAVAYHGAVLSVAGGKAKQCATGSSCYSTVASRSRVLAQSLCWVNPS